MSGETNSATTSTDQQTTDDVHIRSVIGTISQASVRHNEYLEIDSMSVGKPGSPASASSQPIIRIHIEQPLPGDRDPLRMGSVTARPIYDPDADCDGPTTEQHLEDTLRGYLVRAELRLNEDRDDWPPFGIDYEKLGFADAGKDERAIYDFRASTVPIPFEDAIDLVNETMAVLREYRED